jgi:hypothetical protein
MDDSDWETVVMTSRTILVASIIIGALSGEAANPNGSVDEQAAKSLNKIYAASSADERGNQLYSLSCWLSSTNADDISDNTILRIEGLLDDPSDKVKIYATFALSALGARAVIALPKLKDIEAKTPLVNGYGWPNPVVGTILVIEGKDPAGRKRLRICGSPPF